MRILTVLRAAALCISATFCTVYAQGNLLMQEFELLDPLLSASVVASQQAGTCTAPLVEPWGNVGSVCLQYGTDPGTAVAADGTVIRWFQDGRSPDPTCPGSSSAAMRVFVTRPDGSTRESLRAYSERNLNCTINGGCESHLHSAGSANGYMKFTYDVTNGVLLIDRTVYVTDCATNALVAYDSGVIAISGFPTMLDVVLTYQQPATLSFNVPAHPEGLPGADSFSVYSGDVRHASDLSQASALQCTVPSGRPPVPGEQLSVADPLPDPAEGDARYYLAAVNYQGQRRAGRSAINGVLQGRNAAALPGCQ